MIMVPADNMATVYEYLNVFVSLKYGYYERIL